MADSASGGGSGVNAPAASGTGGNPNPDLSAKGASGTSGGPQGDTGADLKALLDAQAKRLDDQMKIINRDRDLLNGKISSLVEALQSGNQAAEKAKSREQLNAERSKIAKKFDDGELTGTQMLELLDNLADQERAARERELTVRDSKIEQLEKMVSERLEALNPEYLTHKEKVDELVEKYGMPRQKAIQYLKDTAEPEQPATPPLAGSGVGGRATGAVEGEMTVARVKEIVRELGGNPDKMTEKQLKELQQKWEKKND